MLLIMFGNSDGKHLAKKPASIQIINWVQLKYGINLKKKKNQIILRDKQLKTI